MYKVKNRNDRLMIINKHAAHKICSTTTHISLLYLQVCMYYIFYNKLYNNTWLRTFIKTYIDFFRTLCYILISV